MALFSYPEFLGFPACKYANSPFTEIIDGVLVLTFGNLFANPYNHPGEARFGFLTEVPGGTELVPTIKEQFPHTSYLFDMMDWNKWWFYNQWGGLGEWVNSNIENGFDGADGISGHPRSESHKTFTKEVVLKWIK